MIAKNSKQVFDDLVYQKYCDSIRIPVRYREPYRDKIESTLGYQRFVFARMFELLCIAVKEAFKSSILGRWIIK
jgi:hypothetical protein